MWNRCSLCFLALATAMLPEAHGQSEHVHITESGDYRYIVSDGIPTHAVGQFPNRGNPNTIRLQYHRYRVPLLPKAADESRPYFLIPFGIALNGIPFDPGAAEFWNGDPNWQCEALSDTNSLGLDFNNAHVQPTGAYHYHGTPIGLVDQLGVAKGMTLLGYAADGFPIYNARIANYVKGPNERVVTLRSSYRLKQGARINGPNGLHDGTFVQDYEYVAGSGDLDECNGRFGPTPARPEGEYYYVISEDFPFIPRRFRGTPDPSFERRGPPRSGWRRGLEGPPPHRRPPPRF